MSIPASSPADASARRAVELPLSNAPLGFSGVIRGVAAPPGATALPPAELERRLIELGFVEGARVEILHQGLIGRDPIAVRVNDATVALRRRDAIGITVEPTLRIIADE